MKKSILVLCDYPLGYTGNAGMAHTIINQIDSKEYDVTIGTVNAYIVDSTNSLPYKNVFLNRESNDIPALLESNDFHFLLIVGHDLWFYRNSMPAIAQVCKLRGTKIVWMFPYELLDVRPDFIKWMELIDYPLVYSKYGYNLLKPHVKNLQYFRPQLHYKEFRKKLSEEERQQKRDTWFPNLPKETQIIGFVGRNQIRKDPQKVIRAFDIISNKINAALYLHTSMEGSFNLTNYLRGLGKKKGRIFYSDGRSVCTPETMTDLYNCFDVLVLPSLQEGLSWTPLEAMLCGCPVVASDTSAHKELNPRHNIILVPCKSPAYLPIDTLNGQVLIDTFCCTAEDVAGGIYEALSKKEELSKKGMEFAESWCDGADNINDVLNNAVEKAIKIETKPKKVQQKILFMQHSSAGDVLMTTQCFKGLKERHKDIPLVYMTQKQFQGILKNNPHIDEIIDWNPKAEKEYALVYNPHGEKILTGGWNNLDVKLYSMYPYFCEVNTDEIFIHTEKPEKFNLKSKSYVVVNTSGASEYRRYEHFNIVFADFKYPVVQLGIESDLECFSATHDLRGELSYTESAYVMQNAIAAVTIDSFCSHLAGALGTPQVTLFGPAPARVTGPRFQNKQNVPIGVIEMQPDMLKVCNTLSHCWSMPPNGVKCFAPCINSISPYEIRKNLMRLIKGEINDNRDEVSGRIQEC
jgi:ADP-heptose:LPS heptosyltransferase/glycosyltransferase involved in cell wall biosynthesis